MKTDRYNIEVLLSEVEHAGRDARRQQELGEMIDRMAGESGKHGAWWWISRVAAAACVLFFVVTAVRIWFIPTDSGAPMVAEAEAPEIVSRPMGEIQKSEDIQKMPISPIRDCQPSGANAREEKGLPVEEQYEPVAVEEYMVEEVGIISHPADEIQESECIQDLWITPEAGEEMTHEIVPESVTVAKVAEESVPVKTESALPADPTKPARRSIFRTLFRPAEPSLMEGTVLALNIF